MATMSFFDYAPKHRQSLGMVDNLVRLALGLEDPEDLIADLNQALGRISKPGPARAPHGP